MNLGYPRVGAAKMALGTVRDFLEKNPDKVGSFKIPSTIQLMFFVS